MDVFYRYPKMYVVRPQFFIPIITLLRSAALNSLKFKSRAGIDEVAKHRRHQVRKPAGGLQGAFGKNYDLASRRFQTAIDEIDKSIDHLQEDQGRPCRAPTVTCDWPTTRRRM